ncbi:tetratricopeptide repeat protein [Catellatospora coxensis]
MADGVNDPHQEALGELALATLALDEHDLDHAVSHLSVALAHEPGLPEAHELLAKLAARCDDGGLSLFRPGERAPVGRVVAFAHVLARHGGYADALNLLAQATVHDPSRPWADVSWVQALDADRIGADRLVRVLLAVLGALPDPAPAPIAAATRPYLHLAERALAAYPREALLHGAASGVARRLREVPLALRWAQRGVELESSKLTEMWWGNALRADGQLAAAVQAMRAAQRHDPEDLSVTSDLALWLTELGHTGEALELIEQALAKNPSYDCAVHTAHRLRFQSDGDPDHLVALADFMRTTTDASHEHHDLQHCCDGLPWLGYVPAAVEPYVDMLRQTTDEERSHPGELGVSTMGSPSALALLRRAWPRVAVAASEPGPPDPGWRCGRAYACGSSTAPARRPRWTRRPRTPPARSPRCCRWAGPPRRWRTTWRCGCPACRSTSCSPRWCTRRHRWSRRTATGCRCRSGSCRRGRAWACCTTAPPSRGRPRPGGGCSWRSPSGPRTGPPKPPCTRWSPPPGWTRRAAPTSPNCSRPGCGPCSTPAAPAWWR